MKERCWMVVLAGATILVYGNSLLNGFTYDDFPYVLNDPVVTNPSIKGFFVATRNGNVFRPVTFATFALNWRFGNIRPFGYHLLNLLLHAAVTVLLYLVLRTLLQKLAQASTISFVTALLFAVHPIHTEAVASISGRSELLAAGFLLVAWLLHLREKSVPALGCFALALLSKESAVAFVPLVLAADYLRGKVAPLSRYLWMMGVGVLYVGFLWRVQGGRFGEISTHFVDNPLIALPIGWRILNALRVAWRYVGLLLYPATLSCDYSYNAIRTYRDWGHNLLAGVGAVILFGLWVWAMRTRREGWALAGAIYLAGFSVTSNILIPTGTILGERLAYLPSAGFCLLAALVCSKLVDRRRAFGWTLLVILATTLGMRTIVRNSDWRSNFTLFSAAVRAVPESARAHSNLGGQYMDQGEIDQAVQELEAALRIYPDLPDALEYYGLIEARFGRDERALSLMEHALSVTRRESTRYVERAVNLAALLVRMGQNEQALSLLDEAIGESPDNTRAWSNRAVVHFRQREFVSARSDAEMALRLDPANSQARNVLGALSKGVEEQAP